MSKTMKTLCRLLSVVLAVLFVFQIMPTETFAAEVQAQQSQNEYTEGLLNTAVDEKPEDKAEIISEVTEKRDEYTKVYKRADGTYTAFLSKLPLHHNDNGVWEDINNTLKSSGAFFENTDGAYEVSFPKEISENAPISVSNGSESISFSLDDIADSDASVKNNIAEAPSSEVIVKEDVEKTASAVTYEDIADNTDLEYVVMPSYIKENIIVSNKESVQNTYSFTINKGSLTASKDENNNISFTDSNGKVQFNIPAPVMTDARNAVSYDIAVALSESSGTAVTLTYTPSAEWLQSANREYPVKIDPVITVTSDNEGVFIDTAIHSDSGDSTKKNTNYYNAYLGVVSNNTTVNADGSVTHSKGDVLSKLNMNAFAALRQPGVVVTNAQFITQGGCYGGNIKLKAINNAWNEQTITYEDVYPSEVDEETGVLPSPLITYDNNVVDYFTGAPDANSSSETSFIHLNFTKLFNEWLSGERANNGFAIVADGNDTMALMLLGGAQSTNSYSAHCLVDYVDTSGLNSNYEYHTQEIGRAGTAYINNFSRALSLSRSDLSLSGNVMPVNILFNYNNAYDNFWQGYISFLNGTGLEEETLIIPSNYGKKWSPGFMRMLLTLNEFQYMYYSGEGALVTFNKKEETSTVENTDGTTAEVVTTVFEEDKGGNSGYTLEVIDQAESVGVENLKIINPNGETELFDENGYAYKIRAGEANSDETYNEINIEYTYFDDAFVPVISCVTDGVGRKYVFNYNNSTKQLSSVSCKTAGGEAIKAGSTNQPMTVNYNYNSDGCLAQVTYPDGESVSYTYDNSGNMTTAVNIDNYKINYTFDSFGKVTGIQEYGYDNSNSDNPHYVAGNSISAEALDSHQTKFVDEENGATVYQYDSNGKLLYTFDENGNYLKADIDFSFEDGSIISESKWKTCAENLLQNSALENGAASWNGLSEVSAEVDADNNATGNHRINLTAA